jgi:hypothetical protein
MTADDNTGGLVNLSAVGIHKLMPSFVNLSPDRTFLLDHWGCTPSPCQGQVGRPPAVVCHLFVRFGQPAA